VLSEIRVRQLGLIEDLSLVLGPGMTALTGETGAGKTLVVEAIGLLLGGRADPVLVRPGATEAHVEGRFETGPGDGAGDRAVDAAGEGAHPDPGAETVLARAVPATGRSRSYIDGQMVTLGALGQAGAELVELHGQHLHQSLLLPVAQREALDAFGGCDTAPLRAAADAVANVEGALAGLGGDVRARAREADLLRYQVEELDQAELVDPDEGARLRAEEERLADIAALREATEKAERLLSGESDSPFGNPGAAGLVGEAVREIAGRESLSSLHQRLDSVRVDLVDIARELRREAETMTDEPARLAEVRRRRLLLRELRRKYGATLGEVIAFAVGARDRLAEIESHDQRAVVLEGQRDAALRAKADAETVLRRRREEAAPRLGVAVETQLHRLAMPRARFEVRVDGRAGESVSWWIAANPGEAVLPLAKVASGGELARIMLAVRLVLGSGARSDPVGRKTLLFDEVDAGIGGEASLAVGQALAEISRHHQVLVVTHLPQVAAFADEQVAVAKRESHGRSVATARKLDPEDRLVELSRMLSGRPDSVTGRHHASELLEAAGRTKASTRPAAGRSGSTR
jgi:DNA repair protein RecN (Recombination protein N)